MMDIIEWANNYNREVLLQMNTAKLDELEGNRILGLHGDDEAIRSVIINNYRLEFRPVGLSEDSLVWELGNMRYVINRYRSLECEAKNLKSTHGFYTPKLWEFRNECAEYLIYLEGKYDALFNELMKRQRERESDVDSTSSGIMRVSSAESLP